MRLLRQAAFSLLILLLGGGPALHAAEQTGCAPRQAHCPMCAHPTEQMSCMGAQGSTEHSKAHSIGRLQMLHAMPVARVVAASDCFCKAEAASAPTEVKASPSPRVDGAPWPALVPVDAWWPRLKPGETGMPAGSAVDRLIPRCRVAPLRI